MEIYSDQDEFNFFVLPEKHMRDCLFFRYWAVGPITLRLAPRGNYKTPFMSFDNRNLTKTAPNYCCVLLLFHFPSIRWRPCLFVFRHEQYMSYEPVCLLIYLVDAAHSLGLCLLSSLYNQKRSFLESAVMQCY